MLDLKNTQLTRKWAWVLVGVFVLVVVCVRVRLREMPLERDEGEYAYAGQLMLQGVPPYREAYNMKLPGTYAAYALIMAVFGQSTSAIHVGLALVNAVSIVLVFLIGRALLDEIAGAVAAVVFALLSTSTAVFGLAAHATHFVTLFALAGTWVLLKGRSNHGCTPINTDLGEGRGGREEERSPKGEGRAETIKIGDSWNSSFRLLASGVLFGLAFLMKQHGIFFGAFGFLYLLWIQVSPRFESKAGYGSSRSRVPPIDFARLAIVLLSFSLGFILPYAVTWLVLWRAGALQQFIFWTFSYARKYSSTAPMVIGSDLLRSAFSAAVGPNLLLWILPWLGALLFWWERRLDNNHRFFLSALFLCSLASIAVGFYFRAHYFITLLPIMALLAGIAVSRSLRLLKHDKTIELCLAVVILLLFIAGSLVSVIGNGSVWFAMSPAQASREIYGTTLFSEAIKVSDYIKLHSSKDARVLIVGSEPEIYFYSHRRSATGYIYMYPLMEKHSYALKMQEEMIAESERAKPEYAVYVEDNFSWLVFPESKREIFDWWNNYWPSNFDLLETIPLKEGFEEGEPEPNKGPNSSKSKMLLLFKRKA